MVVVDKLKSPNHSQTWPDEQRESVRVDNPPLTENRPTATPTEKYARGLFHVHLHVNTCPEPEREASLILASFPVLIPQPSRASAAMAWLCQLCDGRYVTLFSLVSHVRAAHGNMKWICEVNKCSQTFLKANSWCRHVRREHAAVYYGRDMRRQVSDNLSEDHSNDHSDEHSDEHGDEHSDEHGDEQHQDIDISDNDSECANLRLLPDDIGDPSCESDQIAPPDRENACFMSHDVAAGILVSLKEKHHLSQPALDEVVEMTEAICGQF